MRKQTRPRDLNKLENTLLALTQEHVVESLAKKVKNPHAVELGRLGGLKGGKARARMLSRRKRKIIATKAANARWKNNKKYKRP